MLFVEGKSMDNKKLIQELTKNEDIKDIPAIYVLRVTIAVLEAIKSGGCLFDFQEGQVYVD